MTQNTSLEPSINGLYVGEIRLMPFRHNELPFGWHFCNGERFVFTSAQGEVLSSLPDTFRADWGLEEDQCSISLPNLFHEDGRGCFLRPVDGVKRQVGVMEEDAIRNITGNLGFMDIEATGAFKSGEALGSLAGGGTPRLELFMDASLMVPTADENRPLNLGMTPAIYLGV